jgi:double-stranded uracil-DNA glycosylase
MPPVSGFAPVSSASARVLILGSLPGEESLRRAEYYAQSRNAFWLIMGDLFEAGPNLAYAVRLAALTAADIAVWDVCASAHRAGSLDAAIDRGTVTINDFKSFYLNHRLIQLVCFNGRAAAALYEARVMPTLSEQMRGIERRVLPSTSAAHASMTFEAKRCAWKGVLHTQ